MSVRFPTLLREEMPRSERSLFSVLALSARKSRSSKWLDTVVYALAKQLNKEWDQKALTAAFSPESLSMAADDFTDALQNVRRDVGRRLRMSRIMSEVRETNATVPVGRA
jgi:hypothetical protein